MSSDTKLGIILAVLLVGGLSFLIYKTPQWNEEQRQKIVHRCNVAFQMADSQHDTLLVVTASDGACTLTMGDTNAD